MLILRAKTALNVATCMIFFNIFLDNGVMNTWKRRILSLVFTVLCFKNILLFCDTANYPIQISQFTGAQVYRCSPMQY